MSIVLVTKNKYLVASKIHSVVLDENRNFIEYRNKKGLYATKIEDRYNIRIYYTPDSTNTLSGSANHNDRQECSVEILNKIQAYQVYKEIVGQIREQQPDSLFLSKAFENLLTEKDFKGLEIQDNSLELREIDNDRRTVKVRRARKAKRNSKAVLRKAKRRR